MKLLVLLVVLVVGASARSSSTGLQDRIKPQSPRASCPNAADIQPCVCSLSLDGFLDLDCSDVVDEDQLLSVFQADFPSNTFRRFTMYQNHNIKILRDGTFEFLSFEEIWMTDGVLEVVEPAALDGSASTAKSLIFNMNSITAFPFTALSSFTQLWSLDLRINNLQTFPVISCPTLEVLYLSHNPLGGLSVDAFAGTPSLVDLHLSNTQITQVLPGTFEGLTNLRNVGLGSNQITELATNAIQCNSHTGLVDLGYNQVRTVQPGAFPGLKGGWLYIHHNFISTLEEDIWKPLVDFDGYLDPYGDPLLCGCDISWLVHNATLLDAVDIYTTCADGRRLIDLDPTAYDHC